MTDGRIHGVHVWIGPPDEEPPDRVLPGPLKWDLTNGIATDTPESLINSGLRSRHRGDPGPGVRRGPPRPRISTRTRPGCWRWRSSRRPGRTFCSTWDVTDYQGKPITVGFVGQSAGGDDDGGRDRLICRAMNWRSVRDEPAVPLRRPRPADPQRPGRSPACTARWST